MKLRNLKIILFFVLVITIVGCGKPVDEPKGKDDFKQEEKGGRQEDPKQEDPKQEDPKQEDPKQEDPKQEDPKQPVEEIYNLDSQKESVDFKHRVLSYKFTATWCHACPSATSSVNYVKNQSDVKNDVVFVNVYYSRGAFSNNYSNLLISKFDEKGLVPSIGYNFNGPTTTSTTLNLILAAVKSEHKSKANVGIAAKVNKVNNNIEIKSLLKFAYAGNYKVTVWLLEDNLYATQTNALDASYNTHYDVLRYIHLGNSNDYAGESFSVTKEKEYVKKDISIPIDKNWKTDNCKVLIIISEKNTQGKYVVSNVNVCKIGKDLSIEYIK